MNIKNNKNCKITMNDEEIEKYTIKLGKYTIKPETADEMFERLGYKKFNKKHDFENIKYYKDDDNIFYFDETDKSFYKSGEYDSMCDDITMQELQAINKKCKELKWI